MNIFRSNPTANLQTNIQTQKKIPMFSNQSNHYLLKNKFHVYDTIMAKIICLENLCLNNHIFSKNSHVALLNYQTNEYNLFFK